MAAKPKKQQRPDPNIAQRQASDPKASVWVTASAGTGKTKVLTDRVLRLMLSGAKPEEILCITFTKAAASVMTNRIREELKEWATCDDKDLRGRLTRLTGTRPDEAAVKRARRMFAEFLDAHGGMRIQTIHSFSQALLRRFPIESGIPPYFDVMDEQTSSELLRESQAEILRRIQKEPHTPLAKAVNMVTPEVSEEDFSQLIGELTYRRGQLLSIIDSHGGLEQTVDAVYKYLGAQKGADSKALQEQLNSNAGLGGNAPDLAALNAAADILANGTPTDLEKAKTIKAWILHPEERGELFWDYASVFLTGDGEMRKKLTTKASAAAQEALEREAKRLMDGIEAVATMNVARGTESILRMTSAILENYKERKRSQNLLDYDDLVYSANLMMKEENAAAWVLQKLPGNLKHVLVDEAQDTNPDQWKLVSAIVREFFAGKTVTDAADRTLFVVGDEKQSIFSFQRADPREFANEKKYFAGIVNKAGGTWREVELDIAFRSSPAITRAVDAVFDNPAAADGLFFRDEQEMKKVRHDPFRRGQAGIVEVHPVIRAGEKAESKPWDLPLSREDAADVTVEMADKIADKIKGWLDSGEKLESRNRPISPADIMILVRRRSAFVDHMVRALKKRDVPVAGADRMSLRGQIVVTDLVALGECLLFPKDDHKLACVLKSPLIGMNDAELEALAVNRKGSLWDALADKAAQKPGVCRRAHEYLEGLAKNLNAERPYEFYSAVLMNPSAIPGKSGLNALYSRLGFEAEDPLVEFMNALERFEKIHVPSLQGFIAWLDAGEAEVKREINMNAESPRVHIMTVHGAKGLEAPIVILPDTTGIPSDNSKTRPKFLWPDDGRSVPLWVPRADLENAVFAREREQAELERDREFRRLLYVAMTRAADRLYVYGAQNAEKTSEKSWYSLIRSGLEEGLADDITRISPAFNKAANKNAPPPSPAEDVIRFTVPQTAKPEPDGLKPAGKTKVTGIPAWARTAPGADQTPVGKFTPSEYQSTNDNYSAPSPLEGEGEMYFRNLGTAIHQLFEFLPVLPESERAEAMEKHLSKPAWGFTEADKKATAKQVTAILNDPEFGALFGPNSRPEVALSAVVEKGGKKQMMSGSIDRLVVDDKTVTVVDFKNSRKVPKTVGDVQYKYIVQMAAYRLALRQIYPDKEIKCALLWTRQAKLMPIPGTVLDAALDKIDLKPSADKKPAGPR